jgi:hypothetical protein
VRWGATDRDERLQHRDRLIGGDVARRVHDQRLPGELVDDVQALDRAAVGGLVKLKVERPHVPGARGTPKLLGALESPRRRRLRVRCDTRRFSSRQTRCTRLR